MIKQGEEHGPWVQYHDNGQVFARGAFKDGIEVGTWELFEADGTLTERRVYPYEE